VLVDRGPSVTEVKIQVVEVTTSRHGGERRV
jgi:hypothetical protein